MVQDREAALQMGVRVDFMSRLSFAIAGAFAGVSGMLVGLYYYNVNPTMGFSASLKGFAAALLGGLGYIPGAIGGAYLLGLVESFAVVGLGSSYRDLVAVGLLIGVLLLRPRVLLLDEPTAGMNPTETDEMTGVIRQLQRRGLTIVLIEHKLDLVMTVSDKVGIALADQLGRQFEAGAAEADRENRLPVENYDALVKTGYVAMTVPREYGGDGATLTAMLLAQERLARYDGATALGIGWHLAALGKQRETRSWPTERFADVCREVVQKGALINSAASERETGSPSRGGLPTTTARWTGDGWVLSGRKAFLSLAQVLTFAVVSARIEGDAGMEQTVFEAAWFLVPLRSPGVTVDERWDVLGMRATGSHDLVLQNVYVSAADLLEGIGPGRTCQIDSSVVSAPNDRNDSRIEDGVRGKTYGKTGGEICGGSDGGTTKHLPDQADDNSLKRTEGSGAGWGLHIPAVYLGIAQAAQQFVLTYAKERRTNSLQGSIADAPHIQLLLGQNEADLLAARSLLYTVSRQWDEKPQERGRLQPSLGAAKVVAVNNAIAIVDRAMRVAGIAGMARDLPLERYYRDVRAGLSNPPMEDSALIALARHALNESEDL